MRPIHVSCSVAVALALTACGGGGSKLIKHAVPEPVRSVQLAVAGDASLAAELQFVIVRNGPAAWAKNAD